MAASWRLAQPAHSQSPGPRALHSSNSGLQLQRSGAPMTSLTLDTTCFLEVSPRSPLRPAVHRKRRTHKSRSAPGELVAVSGGDGGQSRTGE